jgi:hypothetical protein
MTSRPHRSMPVAAVAMATVLLVACDAASATPTPTASLPASDAASATASASPSASAEDGDGEEVSAFDLATADCFDASGDQVDTVTVVDCESTHTYEVFAVFDHEAGTDAPYPSDDALLDYADTACQPYFEEYVGIAYDDSDYWITSVTPSQERWEGSGDREIVCALKLGEDAAETTGSAEGSGR